MADDGDVSSIVGRAVCSLIDAGVGLAVEWGMCAVPAGRKAYVDLPPTLLSGIAAGILAPLPFKDEGGVVDDLTSISFFILVLGRRLDCRTRDL